jgi:CRP-like cAMP-binding protein
MNQISAIAAVVVPENRLLGALPPEQYARLLTHLTLVSMSVGQVVNPASNHSGFVYFPTTAVLSKISLLANGEITAVTMVGNEGVVGVGFFMGGEATCTQIVVQCSGNAYQIDVASFNRVFGQCEDWQRLLLRYVGWMMTQLGQMTVCYRHHSIDQQLCRWLLQTIDRSTIVDLSLTHEKIATILGVRRESVTEAFGSMRRAGMIETNRGQIKVLDRTALEARTCECYAVVKNDFDRLLPRALCAA